MNTAVHTNPSSMPSANTVAWVFGQPVTDIPQDLFIPPDALEVVLSSFQGPLDLLLYLIRKQNIDVLDIPMVKITEQYLHYIAQMEAYQFDLAAEYLLMAAMLIEIKSRLLLPRPAEIEEEEADPRAELVRRLLAYEQMKLAAQGLDALPRAGRDFAWAHLPLEIAVEAKLPEVYVADLTQAWLGILSRAKHTQNHSVVREAISVRAQMSSILRRLNERGFCCFSALFKPEQGAAYVVVNFIALLELAKEGLVRIVQPDHFGEIEIHIKQEETDTTLTEEAESS
ncbi:segregation and condensation protein A [Neisseria animalis]|uniref:Segregation and condensation protein A n=1 Tax=Neisseria animalis TaxID=492 RepID=A0A5P3MVG2_NEIAN|nr:ScpA family protein [Neisseria animalis]QEY24649.1 segregation/condensation protein A [Neisseria animalis]ROW32940.1 segregation/condensation protein A [Neisseria animalis]VEE07553.1 segregation and condensation protein A [Neisseria animalis]